MCTMWHCAVAVAAVATSSWASGSHGQDIAGIPALAADADDECNARGGADGSCELSLLQFRGAKQVHKSAGSCRAYGCEAIAEEGGDRDCLCRPGCELGQKCCPDYWAVCTTQARAESEAASESESEAVGKHIMTLYHQTSPEAGESILHSGFRPGSSGICGGAIYFSPSSQGTEVKAIGGRGFMLEVQVDLGRTKQMPPQCDHSMTGEKLRAMGYDSLTLDRGRIGECFFLDHCREFIIYDPNRVISIKGHKSWWLGGAAAGVQSWENPNYIGRNRRSLSSGAPAGNASSAADAATPPPALSAAAAAEGAPPEEGAPPAGADGAESGAE